jgi:hypothetical protein
MEAAAETAQAGKANIEANIRHAAISPSQEVHGPFHPTSLQVPMRRLAECGPEGTDEMRFRAESYLRQLSDIEGLRVCHVHSIPGAQHPAVGFLGRRTHRGIVVAGISRVELSEAAAVIGL